MAPSSSIVVVFLLCVTSSYATNVVDMDTICKKATNPSFCLTLLNSKPGPSRDLISFAQYTIDVLHANVTNTFNLINTLIAQSGSSITAREHYKKCLYSFRYDGGALGQVVDAQQHLKTGDYIGVAAHVNYIASDVDYCILGKHPGKYPYHDTSLLPKYADVIYEVADIIIVILTYLVHA